MDESTLTPLLRIRASFNLEMRANARGSSAETIRALKLVLPVLLLVVAGIAILMLWRYELLLLLILCALAFVKHLLFPIPWELAWFVIFAVLGTAAESVIVLQGGTWSYTSPQLFGIPIWLPGIWGLCATSLATSYVALLNSSTKK